MKKDEHLTQDELIMAVIDQDGLSPARQAHQAGCAVCKSASKRLESDLKAVGDMAKSAVPPMRTTIMLPEPKAAKPMARPWGYGWAYGSAFAAALVVLILAVPFFKLTPNSKLEALYQDMLSDAALMLDIDNIQSNPLPQAWSMPDDQDEDSQDEDFMEGIAPGGDDFS